MRYAVSASIDYRSARLVNRYRERLPRHDRSDPDAASRIELPALIPFPIAT
jgi:hypothetical protein